MARGLHRLPLEKPIYELEDKIAELETAPLGKQSQDEVQQLRRECADLQKQIFGNLDPWQTVEVARHPNRPKTSDYLSLVFDEFVELHGDKAFGDDPAMLTGFAKIDRHKVLVVGHQKGKTLAEKQACHFGCAHPEGYRKALRIMGMANRFGLPIVCLIDTAGAYPGVAAEERHIAKAIAINLREMALFSVPMISVVIGEGGSGGALGIGVSDRTLILENAYYSVISPEGCAAILWKDRAAAPQAAEALKITAKDLLELGLVDEVVPEPFGGAHNDHEAMADTLRDTLLHNLEALEQIDPEIRLQERYAKYRSHGKYIEG